MLLRSLTQFQDAGLNKIPSLEDYPARASSLIGTLLSPLKAHHIKEGHVSPLDTYTGPAVVHMLVTLAYPSAFPTREETVNMNEGRQWKAATKTLENAIIASCEMESDSGEIDEALYGRAGLLWAILNLRLWLDDDTSLTLKEERKQELRALAGDNVVEEIFTEIIESGDTGAQVCKADSSEYGLPLIWKWHGKLYLGA